MTEKGLRNIVLIMAVVSLFSNSVVLFRLHETIMTMNAVLYSLDVILALAFSCLSAYSVRHLGYCNDTIRFAAFDGIALLLHFLTFIPNLAFNIIAALFFAVQFFWQVLMIAKLSDKLRAENKELPKQEPEQTPTIQQEQITPIVQQIPETVIVEKKTFIRRINAMGGSNISAEQLRNRRKEFIMTECPEILRAELLEIYHCE